MKKSFLKSFFADKKMVGSMTPSSKFLTQKMLKNVDFKKAKLIVELGPGTGVFTEKILENLSSDAHLMIFELNDGFFENLQKRIVDPRIIWVNDSAEKIHEYLQKNGFLFADYIISSIPLANLPKKITENILSDSYSCLKNQGKFIQFQYSLLSKKLIDNQFQTVHISFTPLNIPPAFVYTCIKEK
ncbi:MAG: methyltransferase domain-containing protein [Flavobacteriia bacterium]|nr:methyltransferase domain-containing protein [Flavobacteriia bacterium]